MKPSHTVQVRVLFLLQAQCILGNPSNTADMAVASSGVARDGNGRALSLEEDCGFQLFLLHVYFKPKAREEVRRMEKSPFPL